MKQFKKILSIVIKNIIIFIFNMVWCNFFIKQKQIALLFAIISTVIISFLISPFLKLFKSKFETKINNKKQFITFKNYLNSITEKEKLYLYKFLCPEIKKIKNNYIFKNNVICFSFFYKDLNKQNLCKFIKEAQELKYSNILILCNTISPQLILYCESLKNFKIQIVNSNKLYSILKQKNFNFETKIETTTNLKLTGNSFFTFFFKKKNAKLFILCGIFTLFSSLFTIFKTYYYILTIILFLCAFICFVKKQTKSSASFI